MWIDEGCKSLKAHEPLNWSHNNDMDGPTDCNGQVVFQYYLAILIQCTNMIFWFGWFIYRAINNTKSGTTVVAVIAEKKKSDIWRGKGDDEDPQPLC